MIFVFVFLTPLVKLQINCKHLQFIYESTYLSLKVITIYNVYLGGRGFLHGLGDLVEPIVTEVQYSEADIGLE